MGSLDSLASEVRGATAEDETMCAVAVGIETTRVVVEDVVVVTVLDRMPDLDWAEGKTVAVQVAVLGWALGLDLGVLWTAGTLSLACWDTLGCIFAVTGLRGTEGSITFPEALVC